MEFFDKSLYISIFSVYMRQILIWQIVNPISKFRFSEKSSLIHLSAKQKYKTKKGVRVYTLTPICLQTNLQFIRFRKINIKCLFPGMLSLPHNTSKNKGSKAKHCKQDTHRISNGCGKPEAFTCHQDIGTGYR